MDGEVELKYTVEELAESDVLLWLAENVIREGAPCLAHLYIVLTLDSCLM